MVRPVFYLILIVFLPSVAASQLVRGRVFEAATGDPLSFASLRWASSPGGTLADMDGQFELAWNGQPDTLICSYIGYQSGKLFVRDTSMKVDFQLEGTGLALGEVLITPEENPAWRIIREVQKRKKNLNPDRLPGYHYKAYSKIVLGERPKMGEDGKPRYFSGGQKFSFLIETVSERSRMGAGKEKEVVLGSQATGMKNLIFPWLATDLFDFVFYREEVTVLNRKFSSPFFDRALNHYEFELNDTVYLGQDTLFIIRFQPHDAMATGFSGVLSVSAPDYALHSIDAQLKPAPDPGLPLLPMVEASLRQQHIRLNDSVWFPSQLFAEYIFRTDNDSGMPVDSRLRTRCYIDSVVIWDETKKIKFNASNEISVDPLAGKRDSLFWENNRLEALDEGEALGFRLMDSLDKDVRVSLNMMTWLVNHTDKFFAGKVPIGKLDFDLSRIYRNNQPEGSRWGLGLETNEELFRKVSFEGFAGYGTRDKKFKYGGGINFFPKGRTDFSFSANYEQNMTETGTWNLFGNIFRPVWQQPSEPYSVRNAYMEFADYRRRISVSAIAKPLNPLQIKVELRNDAIQSPYLDNQESVNCTEAVLSLRFSHSEKFVIRSREVISLRTGRIVMQARITQSLPIVNHNAGNYLKTEAAASGIYDAKRWGAGSWLLSGVYTFGTIPFQNSSILRGSKQNSRVQFWQPFTFAAMGVQQFMLTRGLCLHLNHDLAHSWHKHGTYRPQVVLTGNFALGRISGISGTSPYFLAPSAGYAEAGISLARFLPHIKKKNLLSVYFNEFVDLFGVFVISRFGPYASSEWKENIVWGFTSTMLFIGR